MIRRMMVCCAVALILGCTAGAASSGSDGGAGAPDCGAKTVRRFDGAACTTATATGICATDLGYHSATLETVCAVAPDGTLYLIDVNADTSLSGSGFTFGPRAFGPGGENVYPVERDSLSSADEDRCQSAQRKCSRFGDAGVTLDDGGDATAD